MDSRRSKVAFDAAQESGHDNDRVDLSSSARSHNEHKNVNQLCVRAWVIPKGARDMSKRWQGTIFPVFLD